MCHTPGVVVMLGTDGNATDPLVPAATESSTFAADSCTSCTSSHTLAKYTLDPHRLHKDRALGGNRLIVIENIIAREPGTPRPRVVEERQNKRNRLFYHCWRRVLMR